jgi:putative tryptophan/tyrosine transport system substrate-binding protein
MKRREFILALGAAAAWPLRARAQQPLPIVGYLNSAREQQYRHLTAVFRKGLAEGGYVEGQNVAVEYRWAEGDYTRLPALTADLIKRNVAVIVTHGPPAAKAAKAATSTVPIVFTSGDDPVRTGLVASISRPGGNLTGVTFVVSQVLTKRLGMMRELVPTARAMATLLNPNSSLVEPDRHEVTAAASTLGVAMHVLEAATETDLDKAFTIMVERQVGALVLGADPFFNTRRDKLVALAAQHKIPTMYPWREFAAAGGLMSYGTTLAFGYHTSGLYAARILKGERPENLPVMQPTVFEFVVNLKAAKALGIEMPPMLVARADEVIE